MTKEERLLYYKEGYKKGWANAMERISMEAKRLAPVEDYYIAIADVKITRPEQTGFLSKGKEINIITIMALLDIWRKDKSKLPKQIIFRGHIFDFEESRDLEDYVSRETDSYGDYLYFWDFIENPDILNETVEII